MEAKVTWIKEREYLAEANGCEFLTEGGHGEKAPSPAHYFAAELAGGIADRIGEILRADGADREGLSVEVRSHGPNERHGGGSFDVIVTLPEGLPESRQRSAHKAAESGLEVHALSNATPVRFEYRVLEGREDKLWRPK